MTTQATDPAPEQRHVCSCGVECTDFYCRDCVIRHLVEQTKATLCEAESDLDYAIRH